MALEARLTPSVVVSTLAKAFGALTASELERLEWHRKRGTRVLCGALEAHCFCDKKGGG